MTKLRSRHWPLKIALALMICAFAYLWYIGTRGGVREALHLPLTVAKSMPLKQNGFSLIEAKTLEFNPSRRKILGIPANSRSISVKIGLPDKFAMVHNGAYAARYKLAIRLPDGTVFPLAGYADKSNNRIAVARIAPHYPAGCAFVDLMITGDNGKSAIWRISDLPVTRRAIAENASLKDRVSLPDGISASAKTLNEYDGNPLQEYTINIPPRLEHRWEVGLLRERCEWEYAGAGIDANVPSDLPGVRYLINPPRNGYRMRIGGANSVAGSTRIESEALLSQYEIYDEVFTFHDVLTPAHIRRGILTIPVEMVVESPSGIKVVIPEQTAQITPWSSSAPDTIRDGAETFIKLRAPRPLALTWLPKSPLCRTYGKSVQISPAPTNSTFQPGADQDGNVSFRVMLKRGQPDINLTLRQRVDLRQYRFNFVLPLPYTPAEVTKK